MDLESLPKALTTADVMITCTGSAEAVITLADAHRALTKRGGRSLVLCDPGMPRDVERSVAEMPGIRVIDMETLQPDSSVGAMPSKTDSARGTSMIVIGIARTKPATNGGGPAVTNAGHGAIRIDTAAAACAARPTGRSRRSIPRPNPISRCCSARIEHYV